MSNVGTFNEAGTVMSQVQSALQEVEGNAQTIIEFLDRAIEQLGGLGMPVENKETAKGRTEALVDALAELVQESGDLAAYILALGDTSNS